MKQRNSVFFTCVLLVILLTLSSCTYIIPEKNSVKENSTPPPFAEKDTRRPDADRTQTNAKDAPVQLVGTPFRERENSSPVADFCIIPDSEFYVGMNIFFDAGSSSDPDGDFLEYYWDFGDGSHPFGPTPYNPVCHTFLIKGEYIIRLTVLDNSGGLSVKEKLIIIQDS